LGLSPADLPRTPSGEPHLETETQIRRLLSAILPGPVSCENRKAGTGTGEIRPSACSWAGSETMALEELDDERVDKDFFLRAGRKLYIVLNKARL
jgi:hypothetical protein